MENEDMDVSGSEKPEFSCELCKISYTSESELNDHLWSLMHHIKVEKKKKGSVHNCTLCFTTSQNIIEYGKHLNGDKHKRAIEENRRQKEEEDLIISKNMLNAKLRQKETEAVQNKDNRKDSIQSDRDFGTKDQSMNQGNTKDGSMRDNFLGQGRPFRGKSFRGHQRSFSNPIPVMSQRRYHDNRGNWHGNPWNNNHHAPPKSHFQNWSSQGQGYPNPDSADFSQNWEYNNFSEPQNCSYDLETYEMESARSMPASFENPDYHKSLDKFLVSPLLPPPHEQRKAVDYLPPEALPSHPWNGQRRHQKERQSRWDQPEREQISRTDDLDHVPTQLNKDPSSRRDVEMNGIQRPDRSQEWNDRDLFKSPDSVRIRSRSRLVQDESSPEDSGGQKRRRSDEGHQSRKERRYDSPSMSPSREFLRDSPRQGHREARYRDNSSRHFSEEDQGWNSRSTGKRSSVTDGRSRPYQDSSWREDVYSSSEKLNTDRDSFRSRSDSQSTSGKRSVRFSDEVSSESSKVTDEADSTTDIDSRDSVHRKDKKSEKRKSGGIMKKKKTRSPPSSPRHSPKPTHKTREDEGSSVLERAEKLCKELRDKREKARKEREKKEKEKKLEKQDELNEQLKTLAEKNKEYVKGHVSAEEEKQCTENALSDSVRDISDGTVSNKTGKDAKQVDSGIDAIRKKIENSVPNPKKPDSSAQKSSVEKSNLKELPAQSTKAKDASENQVRDTMAKPPKEREGQRVRKNSVQSDQGIDISKAKSATTLERDSDTQSPRKKDKEGLSRESLLKMVNSPRSRKERQKLAEILRSYASSQNKLSLPRFNVQLSGVYDKLETQMDDLHLEELSPEVQLQIAELIEADVKPDISELESALFPDSATKGLGLGQELHRTDSNEITSTTPSTGTRKVRQPSVEEALSPITVSGQGRHIRSRSQSGSEITLSERSSPSIHIKQEPVDSGYGHSSSYVPSGSDKNMDLGSSAVVSSSGVSDMDTGEVPGSLGSVSTEMVRGKHPTVTNNEGTMNQSYPSSSGSGSQSAESIFDTMYDMSVKEETIRNELKDVYGQIDYLKKVIEEASIQLNRYTEKKLRLEQDENELRKKRLKILQDAKIMHRSNPTTPMSSDVEMVPDVQGKMPSSGLYSEMSQMKVPPLSTPVQHSGTTSFNSKSLHHMEAERDKQSSSSRSSISASSHTSTNRTVMPTSGFQSSEPLLQQLQDLSSSLRKDTEKTAVQGLDRYENSSVQNRIINSPFERESGLSTSEMSRTMTGRSEFSDKVSEVRKEASTSGFTSPVAFKDRDNELTVTGTLPPPLEPTRGVPSTSRVQLHSSTGKSGGQSEGIPTLAPNSNRSDSEVSRSTDLHAEGFVTLNSLMQNVDPSSKTSTQEGGKVDDARQSGQTQNTSDALTKRMGRVEYVGSIPTSMDYDSFFKTLQGHGPYVVVDGTKSGSAVLQQIESLMAANKTSAETDVAPENKGTKKEKKPRKLKSTEQGSEAESVNSNCSLGEKISRYAKRGKSKATSPRKGKPASGKTDSESEKSDRTIQGEPEFLSDSSTPVKLHDKGDPVNQSRNSNYMVLRSSQKIPDQQEVPLNSEDDKNLSPSKKKLKSKKERDRRSVRKKKEEFVIDSSSEGNSYEGDGIPKLSDVKQQLMFKSVNNIPAAVAAEGSEFDEAGLVETGSESTAEITHPLQIKQEVDKITPDKPRPRSLLEDVQLDSMTESEDSRANLASNALLSERFRLKPDVIQSLQSTVKSTLQRTRSKREVKFFGPMEVVTGLQIVNSLLYVSYQMNFVKCFSMETGDVVREFNCGTHSINCMLVTMETAQLFLGCSSYTLICFECESGELHHKDKTEGGIQCMHEDWGKLFLGTDCGTVIVKKLQTNKILDTFLCTDRPISCITSAREGSQRMLVIGSFDAIIYVYDSSSGLLVRMLEGHTHTPFSIQIDGTSVFSGSGDKTVMEHNLLTGELLWTCSDASSIVSNVAVYGDLLFSASYDRYIRCYLKKSKKRQMIKVYYGADIGLVTKMLVQDGKLITGNRKGVVESLPLNFSDEFPCQQRDCEFVFGIKSHLQHHAVHGHLLLYDKVFHCQWNGCGAKVSVEKDRKEAETHMKSHIP